MSADRASMSYKCYKCVDVEKVEYHREQVSRVHFITIIIKFKTVILHMRFA